MINLHCKFLHIYLIMKITDLLLEQPGPSKAIINSILINSGVENSPSRDQIVNDITTKYYPRFKQIQNGLNGNDG